MRIKTKVDVRVPLTRKKKICRKDKTECIVNCKYEKLGDFYSICGMLTHTERFCRKRLEDGVDGAARGWGSWVRAPPRRGAAQGRSKWLQNEGAEVWGENHRKDNNQGFQNSNAAKSGEFQRQKWKAVGDKVIIQGFGSKGILMDMSKA